MANADQSPLDIHKRFAALERRVAKLESGLQEMDRVIDPEGWIGEAFDVLGQNLTDFKNEMQSMNAKLDTLMKHITGISGAE